MDSIFDGTLIIPEINDDFINNNTDIIIDKYESSI